MLLVPCISTLIAKLALTNTFHMRTTHFLLDRLSTFRTLSCVIFYPTGIDFARVEHLVPFLDVFAGGWVVRFLETFEAIQFSTGTANNG